MISPASKLDPLVLKVVIPIKPTGRPLLLIFSADTLHIIVEFETDIEHSLEMRLVDDDRHLRRVKVWILVGFRLGKCNRRLQGVADIAAVELGLSASCHFEYPLLGAGGDLDLARSFFYEFAEEAIPDFLSIFATECFVADGDVDLLSSQEVRKAQYEELGGSLTLEIKASSM